MVCLSFFFVLMDVCAPGLHENYLCAMMMTIIIMLVVVVVKMRFQKKKQNFELIIIELNERSGALCFESYLQKKN